MRSHADVPTGTIGTPSTWIGSSSEARYSLDGVALFESIASIVRMATRVPCGTVVACRAPSSATTATDARTPAASTAIRQLRAGATSAGIRLLLNDAPGHRASPLNPWL